MAKIAVLGLAALLAWTLAATAALADEHNRWQKLENNPACVVWNEDPQEQETVTWSGPCANGKAQGHGTAVWRIFEDWEWKESRYEGAYKNGKMHGRGVIVYPSGDRYEGDWKDDKNHVHGVYVWASGNRYEGDFKDDKIHGHGVLVWASGDRYEGGWKDGKKHGRGVSVWGPNSEWAGNRYEGDYKNGRYHGHGTYYFADGDECEGDWREGKLMGTGRGWTEGRQKKCYLDENDIRFTD